MKTRDYPNSDNTELHYAILERKNDIAFDLIEKMTTSDINTRALGNTPLMLALKTANFDIARALLKRDDINVVPIGEKSIVADYRGITPLHLACAWRESDIILGILNKYHTYITKTLECEYPIHLLFSSDQSIADTLQLQLLFSIAQLPGVSWPLKKLTAKRTPEKIYLSKYDLEIMRKDITFRGYFKSVVEHTHLIIDAAPELTDALLFHSKLICLNLGLVPEDSFKEFCSSQHQFANDLHISLSTILDYRNNKPVDENILATMRGKDPEESTNDLKITNK